MAQGKDGQAGSRRRFLLLRDMGPLFCPGQINALYSIQRGKPLHPRRSSHTHGAASFVCAWISGCPRSGKEKWDVFISLHSGIHKQSLRTCHAYPLPLLTIQHPTSWRWVPLPGARHHSVGVCQALGMLQMWMLLIWGDAFQEKSLLHCRHAACSTDLGRFAWVSSWHGRGSLLPACQLH